jgi:putative FmdB family regulatory protein
MPRYDYECEQCGNVQEEIHSMFDVLESHCDKCGHTIMRRLISSPSIQIVGTTVGSLGEKNWKALSSEEKAKLSKPQYEEKNPLIKKYGTKTDAEVMKMTAEQKKRYIFEGK